MTNRQLSTMLVTMPASTIRL